MTALNQNPIHRPEGMPTLAVYCASRCGMCRRLEPIVRRLAQQYGHDVAFSVINIDENPEIAVRERIEVVPTLVLYRQGREIGSMVVPECGGQIEAFLREKHCI